MLLRPPLRPGPSPSWYSNQAISVSSSWSIEGSVGGLTRFSTSFALCTMACPCRFLWDVDGIFSSLCLFGCFSAILGGFGSSRMPFDVGIALASIFRRLTGRSLCPVSDFRLRGPSISCFWVRCAKYPACRCFFAARSASLVAFLDFPFFRNSPCEL